MTSSSLVVYNSAMPGQIMIPEMMGLPAEGQANGTELEILAEIAGRVCYDSFGKGRNSNAYHKHILEVGHRSVYEHCTFVVEFDQWWSFGCEALMNRPGVFFRRERGKVRLTVNLRAILEWDNMGDNSTPGRMIGNELKSHAHTLAPQVVGAPKAGLPKCSQIDRPKSSDEVWVSVFLSGSRNWSHEMVRHGDWSAISQRSTRYVDEDKSPNIFHPQLRELLDSEDEGLFSNRVDAHEDEARELYADAVHKLGLRGCDRKQSRGAARGLLLTCLETQMIFSASLAQWERIFAQRCSPFADEEIRNLMMEVKRSIYNESDEDGERVS